MTTKGDRRESAVRRLWSLTDDVLVESDPDRVVVVSRWGETVLSAPSADVRQMLQRMTMGPIALDNVATSEHARRLLRADLGELQHRLSGSLEHSLVFVDSGRPIVSVSPTAAHAPFEPRVPLPSTVVRLSRYCTLWSGGTVLHARSTPATHRVVLYRPGARLVGLLATSMSVSDLAAEFGETVPVTAAVVGYLLAAGAAVEADAVPDVTVTGGWGRDHVPWGFFDDSGRPTAVARHDGVPAPGLAAVVGVTGADQHGSVRVLPPPASCADAVLHDLLGTSPVTPPAVPDLAHVGTLLHRLVLARAAERADTRDRFADETFLLVGEHAELRSAAYRYDAGAHGLVEIDTAPPAVGDALDAAQHSAGLPIRPELLLVATARPVERVRTTAAGLASTLVHLGRQQRTVQLLAAEIGLAVSMLAPEVEAPAGDGHPQPVPVLSMIIGP